MSDSLRGPRPSFEGLRLTQTTVLVEVLRSSSRAERGFVERRFHERASGFPETLAFLMSIQAVKAVGDTLTITEAFGCLEQERAGGPAAAILQMLLEADTPYRSEMLAYLRRFRIQDGTATYRPSVELQSAESAVRNYLIDLGVLSYDESAACYVVAREHSNLYAFAWQEGQGVSPDQFRQRMQAREALGLRAELEMMRFERLRVGSQFENRVIHIGAHDVAAGYDILSLTLARDNSVVPRYIEVKAVPTATYCFCWTENELAMAKLFGTWYYLYLVPVGPGGCIDAENVRIISDPHSAVLGPGSGWIVQTGMVKCSLSSTGQDNGLHGEVQE
jgi:hypothetical protein